MLGLGVALAIVGAVVSAIAYVILEDDANRDMHGVGGLIIGIVTAFAGFLLIVHS